MNNDVWKSRWFVGVAACGIGIAIGYSFNQPSSSSLRSKRNTTATVANGGPSSTLITATPAVLESETAEATGQPVTNGLTATAAIDWLFGSENSFPTADGAQLMRQVMTEWAADNPAAAQAFLRDQLDNPHPMQQAMTTWATEDPTAAQSLLMGHLDHPSAGPFLDGLMATLPVSDSVAAMKWADRMTSPDARIHVWVSGSLPLLFSDPDQAEQLLEQSSFNSDEKQRVRDRWNHSMASSQRNAQNMVSVIGAAQAAGTSFVPDSVESLVEQLSTGITGSGTFADSVFKISPLSPVEVEMVRTFVEVDATGSVSYRSPSN